MTASADFDVVVVGGGVVGLCAAMCLAHAGHGVAVIESRVPSPLRGRSGFAARTVALNAASRQLLEELGAWPESRIGTIDNMRAWERDGTATLHFDSHECDQHEPLAYVLEHDELAKHLWHRLPAENIEVIAPTRVTDLREGETPSDPVMLHTQQGSVSASLVVAADGAGGVVGRAVGVAVMRVGDEGRALATVARTARGHEGTAWQRFGTTGPVALLPLADAHCVAVIWSTDIKQHEQLRQHSDDAFCAALDAETESVLGIEAVDERIAFPLRPGFATNPHPHRRVVLIGDAARTMHPLAGQGMNVGLEDVAELARACANGVEDAQALKRFARIRRARSRFMVHFMAAMQDAYAMQGPFARLARNVGVRFLDHLLPAKAQLIREAMGRGSLARTAPLARTGSLARTEPMARVTPLARTDQT